MGNSQAKEARGRLEPSSRHNSVPDGASSNRDIPESANTSARPVRPRRGSRPDFTSFLGIGGGGDQDAASLEARRENKLERETRRAEKEKQARLKERERSMREEHVDGGYLVTQGVYVGVEDYNKQIVRQLMIERRLAPFWRGLNEYSPSWAEHQLMAAARGMPIPPPDEVPPELEYSLAKRPSPAPKIDTMQHLTIPIESRTQSFQSEQSVTASPVNSSMPLPSPMTQSGVSPTSGPLFRARAKTLANLTSSRNTDSKEVGPREFQLPPDAFVNGQPIEVYLYKDADECPICFLSYPPYLNTTRCCEQSICSECFVQIKRPDPHPPEHETPDPNAPPVSEEERLAQAEGQLVSEVATCPYCKQPEFGITYAPPPFRRGLTYGAGSHPYQVMSAMSSQTSISSGQVSPNPSRRRGTSLSANSPEVITTDKIRPDWASRLAAARAHAARRAAAATALHTAAYMMNGIGDRPVFPGFGRRGVLRRPAQDSEEQHAQVQRHLESLRNSDMFAPPRGSSSRRPQVDDLEEIMMMEAIRLSLASEEERRKKEEKEAKKKAKREEKESRKSEKGGKKAGQAGPSSDFGLGQSVTPVERPMSSTSTSGSAAGSGKGKGVDRTDLMPDELTADNAQAPRQAPNQGSFPSGTGQESVTGLAVPPAADGRRVSHLRQMSNASSTSSSFVDPATSFPGSGTPPSNTGLEPMFNFRSLTAMINEDEKTDSGIHIEDGGDGIGRQASLETVEDQEPARSRSSGQDIPQ